MFRVSFGQRLVMVVAYVLLLVVSRPLTALLKTAPPPPSKAPPPPSEAPPRPTATAPPSPSDTAPPPPSEAPPRPTATAPPSETPPPPSEAPPRPTTPTPPPPSQALPRPTTTASPPPSDTAPPRPSEAPPRSTATPPPPSDAAPPPPSEASPVHPSKPVLRVWPDHPSPGQTIKVDGEGRWPAGEMITVSLVISDEENKVVSSDTVHVGDNGTFTTFVTVPEDVEPGTPAIVDAVGSVTNQVYITIGGEV